MDFEAVNSDFFSLSLGEAHLLSLNEKDWGTKDLSATLKRGFDGLAGLVIS